MPRKAKGTTTAQDAVTTEKKYRYVNTPFDPEVLALYEELAKAFHTAQVIDEPKVTYLIKWCLQKLAEDMLTRRREQLRAERKRLADAEYEKMLRAKYPDLLNDRTVITSPAGHAIPPGI